MSKFDTAKSKGKKSTVKTHEARCANTAALEGWRGWEQYAPFEASKPGLFYTKEQSGAFEKARVGKDMERSCAWLAVAAFATPKYMMENLAAANWGVVTEPSSFFKYHAKQMGISFVMHVLRDGQLTQPVKVGSGKIHHLLIVYKENGPSHVLPVARMDRQAQCVAVVTEDQAGAAAEPEPVAPAEASSSPKEDPEPEGASSGDDSDVFFEVEEPHGSAHSEPRGPPPSNGWAGVARRPFYYGCLPPGPECRWIGGWWPSTVSTHPVEPTGFAAHDIASAFRKPDLILATVENVKMFGLDADFVHVNQFPIPETVRVIDVNTLTDGRLACSLIHPGTCLYTSSGMARAKEVTAGEHTILRFELVNQGFWAKLSELISSGPCEVSQVVHPRDLTNVHKLMLSKARWTIVQSKAKDPVTIAMLSQARTVDVANGHEANPYDVYEALVAEARAHGLPEGMSLAGKEFGWGYCFSCGDVLPGRFPGRMCKPCNARRNSMVGRLVADGLNVCTHTHPVCETGVVHTDSRHPPLKVVGTRATERNFQVAPPARWSGTPLNPTPGVARAWVGSA